MALRIPHRSFTVDEYYRLYEVGILPESGTELIGGQVLSKMVSGYVPRRWTYDEYLRMADSGIIRPDERVELIDGEIVPMSPAGKRHSSVVLWLSTTFPERVRGRAMVRVQNTFRLDAHETPEPDILLLKPREDFYLGREAGPHDALLVIEVSDTTLSYDRGVKRALYARFDIPELWIVDVQRRRVIVHREPRAEEYTDVREYGAGESWHSPALDGEIRTEDVLGPAAA